MTTTLSDVKAQQPQWFSPQNKRFFGDVGYKVLHGKITERPYLVQHTAGWSDMFGRPKKYVYIIRPLNDELIIQSTIDIDFKDIDEVKDWLKTELLPGREES